MWIDVVKLFLDARCCDGITGCGLMPLLGMLSIDSVVNTYLNCSFKMFAFCLPFV